MRKKLSRFHVAQNLDHPERVVGFEHTWKPPEHARTGPSGPVKGCSRRQALSSIKVKRSANTPTCTPLVWKTSERQVRCPGLSKVRADWVRVPVRTGLGSPSS